LNALAGNFLAAALMLLYQLTVLHAASIPLQIDSFNRAHPSFKDQAGTVTISGPISLRLTPATQPESANNVLALEYFCIGGLPTFAALPGPPYEAATARMLPAIGHCETWTGYTARIVTKAQPLPNAWKDLRLDLPLPAGSTLQIRNAVLRPEIPGEFDAIAARPAASAPEAALNVYLGKAFPTTIQKVSVGKDQVRIQGNIGKEAGPFMLADIPMDIVLNDNRAWENVKEISPTEDGTFSIDLPRQRERNGLPYDRLTSRWQIVRKTVSGLEPVSHARYADWVDCRAPGLPAAEPKNKKGLGGWGSGRLPNELDELGISAVTVNLMLQPFISLTPGTDTVPIEWQGRKYFIRESRFKELDESFRVARKHGVMVSVILLVANPAKTTDPVVKLMGHPDAVKEGTFAMPNVTSEEGIGLYGALLNFMAERWTRPDEKYGRVHHWIIHNEVDAGWVWTNAGDKPAVVYMDLYQRSMRLTDLIVRQYDPNARPFISLTHHWASNGSPRWYGSRRLIDLLVKFCKAEGDFPWALAYHPYPQNLRNPRTWEDDQATFSFDSKKITPRNLEVLDAYMKRPELLFNGKGRPVHLSENGFNSIDYSAKSLEDQAAGMAFAWKKIQSLSSIQSWQYHNWIDNRGEGGLRIGLRKFPDEPGDPAGKKPIWFLYQALGTPQDDAVAAPYLKTIGIRSWDEAIHKEPIR
jgi:hypothetical protein